jgi:3-hydroxyacyl-CoA dehydrogenase
MAMIHIKMSSMHHPPRLIQLVSMGYLGKKVEKEFYDWPDSKNQFIKHLSSKDLKMAYEN